MCSLSGWRKVVFCQEFDVLKLFCSARYQRDRVEYCRRLWGSLFEFRSCKDESGLRVLMDVLTILLSSIEPCVISNPASKQLMFVCSRGER